MAKLNAKIFQLMPKPLLTLDQLILLKYDNIPSGKFKTNLEFKMKADKKFEEQINLYSFNWTRADNFQKIIKIKLLMLTNIIYLTVFIILVFVLSIAVKAITRGVEAKQLLKEESNLDSKKMKPMKIQKL